MTIISSKRLSILRNLVEICSFTKKAFSSIKLWDFRKIVSLRKLKYILWNIIIKYNPLLEKFKRIE